jgi:hypothetical protein
MIGYFIAYFSFVPFIRRDIKIRETKGSDALAPESRLYWLLWRKSVLGWANPLLT